MRNLLFLLLSLLPLSLWAEVKLPNLFSDHMVLQRDANVRVWGTASKGEKITVEIAGQKEQAKVQKDGSWEVFLSPMAYGGPYTLSVQSKENSITLKDVLIGDVWVCSGQSNMEMNLQHSSKGDIAVKEATHDKIRSYIVKRKVGFDLADDVNTVWEECTPANAGKFSAVAYYYASKIYKETGIPIGIINTSWGGSSVESWTSIDSFNKLGEKYTKKYDKHYPLVPANEFFASNNANKEAYLKALSEDVGMKEKWYLPATVDWQNCKELSVPQSWNANELRKIDGVVWTAFTFDLPAKYQGKMGRVCLGTIGDEDITWINGVEIGRKQNKFRGRDYIVPPDVLKAGKNTLIVKITDNGIDGGINGNRDKICLQINEDKISLTGKWRYKVSVDNNDYDYKNVWRNDYPSLCYNAMLHPLLKYSIAGVLWYQGEQNGEQPENYDLFLSNLIDNWRNKWGYEFPFYVIQLPNFRKSTDNPAQRYKWAEMRAAQTSILSMPQTGVVSTIDLGMANDIHPTNKKDVGYRSALVALRNYYEKNVVSAGPVLKQAKLTGDRITIDYDLQGAALKNIDKYQCLRGFTLFYADGTASWAQAYISGEQVVVVVPKGKVPTELAYNWADNPDGTLYNSEDLPALSFRIKIDK